VIRVLLVLSIGLGSAPAHAQAQSDDPLATAEGLVTHVYGLVTFGAGTTPNWDEVRSMFIPEAIIVARDSDGMKVMSVEGFIDDWLMFIERASVEETGFSEKIIRMKSMVFGDIAQVLVLFESSIPGRDRAHPGVDSFELVRNDGRWWIVSITNERPGPDRPIPDDLQG
jgi:hypothetical protein